MNESQQRNLIKKSLAKGFKFLDGLSLITIVLIEISLLIGMLLCFIHGAKSILDIFLKAEFLRDSTKQPFSIEIIHILEIFLLAISLFIISRSLHEFWGYKIIGISPLTLGDKNLVDKNKFVQFHNLEISIFTSICIALTVLALQQLFLSYLTLIGLGFIIIAISIFVYAISKCMEKELEVFRIKCLKKAKNRGI